MAQDALEDAEHGWRQLQLPDAACGLMLDADNPYTKVFDQPYRLGARVRSPLQSANALDQDLDAKWLGDVIVGPNGKTDHLIRLLALGRQHQNWHARRLLAGPQLPADLQPVHARQHQIEQNQVRRIRL